MVKEVHPDIKKIRQFIKDNEKSKDPKIRRMVKKSKAALAYLNLSEKK